jgi:NADPH:quinone reductase-like Zn-dependent oxidoreductase
VRKSQLAAAASLGTAGVVALDDEEALAKLGLVDAVADTVGGAVAAGLIAHVKPGGTFGYASVLPEGTQALHPAVTITRVFAKPDPSKVREFADDVRDGKFILPIGRRLPLADAAEAHVLGEKGNVGKIILLIA